MADRPKVYIDGKEGTTGLQIYQRLGGREDIELLLIEEEKRKDAVERAKCLNGADLVFLCLPDDAAREAVALIGNDHTRVIDASTAHRTAPGWTYGFAELLPGQRQRVKQALRVTNPGCHATGFLACTVPLIRQGAMAKDYPVACYSLTGYSGGGKKLIAEYEDPARNPLLDAPCPYALDLKHKHLPEMQALAELEYPPAFSPVLGDIYKGMATCILLHNHLLRGHPALEEIHAMCSEYYEGQTMVKVAPLGNEPTRFSAGSMAGRDDLVLYVTGNGAQTMITALFDNLGKGASGAAVQNMNLMLGFEETRGLALPE